MRFFSVFRYFYKKIKVHFAFSVKYDILLNNYIRFARKVTVFVDFPGFSTYFWVQFAYWVENSSEVKIYTNRTRFLPLFRVNIHLGRVSEHSNTRAKTLRHATEMGVEEAVCKQGETGCPFLIAPSDIPSIVPWTEPVRQLYQFIFVLQDFPDRCLLSTGSTGIWVSAVLSP